MDVVLLGALAGLALVDSTSIGTLVIPVWMLLTPGKIRPRRLMTYLGVLGGFYAVVGLLIFLIARAGKSTITEFLDTPLAYGAQLFAGIALFAWSFRFDSKKRRESGTPDRTQVWRERVLTNEGSRRGIALLALSAGAVELLTMVPYLAAIGLIVAAGQPLALSVSLLVGYCAIMITPALMLLGARVAIGTRLDRPLRKVDDVMSRYADTAIGWTLGIVGFFLAANAAQVLFVST